MNYNPLFLRIFLIYLSIIIDSKSITLLTSKLGINNPIEATSNAFSDLGSFNKALFNSPYYKLESDSKLKHYIIKEGLFTCKLVSFNKRFK